MRPSGFTFIVCNCAFFTAAAIIFAQGQVEPGGAVANDAPQVGQAPNGGGPNFSGGGAGTFPTRPSGDKASIERGKKAYDTNCSYCHGDDARGGNGGPNILESEFIMKDRDGEVLREFLLNRSGTGHTGVREGTVKFGFTKGQANEIAAFVTDVSAFIHDFPVSSRDRGRMRPLTIVVGDPKAGEAYFNAHCASCHSPDDDLKGIAARVPDPRTLQQRWLMPRVYGGRAGAGGLQGVTVTVTQPDGQKIEGRLGRLDDFVVTLTDSSGAIRAFDRDKDWPKVEVHDPMQPHRDLLPGYTDKDIHDVTAWMVTLR